MIASCSYLEEKFQECSHTVDLATSVETSGVDLRTSTEQFGAKGKARRKKCDLRLILPVGIASFRRNT